MTSSLPMATSTPLPVGKLAPELLSQILSRIPLQDPRLVLGPGIGMDCAVVDLGDRLAVYKSDPITFASDHIGYYLVQVNANDVATTGARPLWLLVTLLLPEKATSASLPATIMAQITDACVELGVTVIGGHTEITTGLDRPIAIGTMIGEVERDKLISPRGVRTGDRVLLTKGVPIEATALLAREFPARLRAALSPTELQAAQDYLFNPGIGITRDARTAVEAGQVTAMHDPTEGGVLAALWELAQASRKTLRIDTEQIPVPPLARRVCDVFGIDPLGAIASGALLMIVQATDAPAIRAALQRVAIACADIGSVHDGPARVERTTTEGYEPLSRPEVDEITKAYA